MEEKNSEGKNPIDFQGDFANAYEDQIQRIIPTYPHIFSMAETYLAHLLPERADVLVVGAGGGKELLAFGQPNPEWVFTGVDPSPQMLAIAKKRIDSVGLTNRIHLVEGKVEDLPPGERYDAATSLLVLHFLPDAEKVSMLQTIAKNLSPGAPLLLASLVGAPGTPPFGMHLSAWSSHWESAGVQPEALQTQKKGVTEQMHLISETDVFDILENAGFINIERFYYSYMVGGWIAFKA